MKPLIDVYTDSYHDAKMLFNTLLRLFVDKGTLCSEESWENGGHFRIERDTEVWRIFMRESDYD
jgi:hypothetical protein